MLEMILAVSDLQLLEDFTRLRPQHSSNAATHRALAIRYNLTSEASIRKRIARARKRQQKQAKAATNVIPMDAIPDGYFVKRLSTSVDKDGIVQEQWLRSDVESKHTAEIQTPVPDGHLVKGVSTYLDEQGRVRGQWIKSDRAHQQWQDTINAVLDRIPALIYPLPPVHHAATHADNLLALYPLADLHIGLYASLVDAERDWRLSDAVTMVKACVDDLIERTPPARRAVVAQMGDFAHIDNLTNRTPNSGAALDADGRLIEIVQAAMELAIYVINRVAGHHDHIAVVWQSGNHDESTALVLQTALAALYRDNERIHVHQSGKRTHVIQHKQVALGFTHGDTIKPDKLPLIMANDYPDIWAATRYRVWHTGHLHHKAVQEHIGCMIETHQSPTPRDSWHERSGYRSGHSMCSIVYDGIGEYTRNTIQVRHAPVSEAVTPRPELTKKAA